MTLRENNRSCIVAPASTDDWRGQPKYQGKRLISLGVAGTEVRDVRSFAA